MYEAVIGLEVHVQLATDSKIFCGCPTKFGGKPNTQACAICLGFPGVLPVLNRKVLEYGIKAALALNCSVQPLVKFDRKNYFYPDLPKAYQISQYDLPLSYNGWLEINSGDTLRRISIKRVHLEEDAGKLIHGGKDKEASYVDYNRAGMPLLEIVSEPEISSPEEAHEYLTALKSLLKYLEISDCDMEKGSLRCDANISIRQRGEAKLGVKTELKNMNSFKAVKAALEFEIIRQEKIKREAGKVIQETLLWDEKNAKTVTMRTKEEAHDYRYFPEPDLPPFTLKPEEIERIRRSLPELPRARLARFMGEYGLVEYNAKILIADKYLADYFEQCAKIYKNYKNLSNWIIGPLFSELNNRKIPPRQIKIKPQDLARLIVITDNSEINNLTAKAVLAEMFESAKSAEVIIREKNLAQISDEDALGKIIDKITADNPKSVNDYKNGKANALMFLIGQAMKQTKGKANPKLLEDLFKRRLDNA